MVIIFTFVFLLPFLLLIIMFNHLFIPEFIQYRYCYTNNCFLFNLIGISVIIKIIKYYIVCVAFFRDLTSGFDCLF